MANLKHDIYEIDALSLARFDDISAEENRVLEEIDITRTFDPTNHFIELSYFSLNDVKLNTFPDYRDYSILSGDTLDNSDGNTEISIDVKNDYIKRGYETQEVKALYNFLNYVYSDDSGPQDFFIESISPDRKEIRLLSVDLGDSDLLDISEPLVERFNSDTYIPELYLYFENNLYYSIVNLQREVFQENEAVLVKLHKPLPNVIRPRTRLNIVEKISEPVAYEINVTVIPEEEKVPFLRGPNFTVELDTENVEPSKYFNYNELFSFPVNNTYRQLSTLFNEKGAELGIDYSDFSYFINFSSAEERIRNFKYKLDLIESYQTNLDLINTTSNAYTATGITGSREYYIGLIDGLINNLDHYERHLYYESGSTSWPKVEGSSVPYINQLSSTDEATSFFNSEIQDAVLYDAQNQNLLANTIPTFLREDSDNRPYEIFIHMIAQHFDNLWIYTDAVSKKYDADNRLERGVSKDLIEDLLKNFGVKLYTSNRSLEDLFRYFTFDSYDLGNESSATIQIAQPDKPLSQKNYQKSIYKRIYHNLSLLMKSKGTERGLRALINCFGIPSNILKIKIFGGQSAKDLPYFGGEQAFTGSIDKVRLNNTGSIVPGDTISYYTSILNYSNDYTQDLHRIEVGFSPSDNIDSYIVSQSAVLFPDDPFNIDQYIGDPRQSLTNRYEDLKTFSESIFENVTEYNVKDFVRLIKFFDNVIFRMVRDFTPARSITDTGIIIKPHLLDRSKVIAPTMTWTQPEYTGSIDTAFMEGSNAGIFKSSAALTSDKELNTNYLKRVTTPSGSRFYRRINNFDVLGLGEKLQIEKNFGEVKFDGEFRNSRIRVTNGELNEDNPYKQIDYPVIDYNLQFYNAIPDDICILSAVNNPFIVTPGQNVNIPSSNIFIGATAVSYTFLVDGSTPNQGNGFNHVFEGDQYEEFVVSATNNDSSITNANTGEACTADRTVKIVDCRINDNAGNPINPVTLNIAYNLFNFFFNQETLNTELTYKVNGTTVATTVEGETLVPFTFTDDSLNNAIIEVHDTNDSTCKKVLNLDFVACGLADPYFNSTSAERENIITQFIANAEGVTLGQGPLFYVFPFGLIGTNNTTNIKFQLYVVYNPEGQQALFNNEFEAEFLSNEVQIENPTSDQAIGIDNSGVGVTLIPNSYAGIVSTFRNDPIPEDGLPQGTTVGLNPLTTGNTIEGAILQGTHDPYLLAAAQGAFEEKNYLRYIRFIADNGIVNGVACTVTSGFYLIKSASTHRISVDITYADGTALQGAYVGCQVDTNSTITVYVEVPDTVMTITSEEVVKNKYYIYANETGETPAPGGMYMYGGENIADSNNILTGNFSQGRTGRFWDPEFGINPWGGWDDQTVQPSNGNIIATDVIFGHQDNPGLFVCDAGLEGEDETGSDAENVPPDGNPYQTQTTPNPRPNQAN